MKKVLSLTLLICISFLGYSQIDTISQNIYQLNGKIGIGAVNYGSYFNPILKLYNGWLQVSDSSDHDAGIVVSHLNTDGYGFARTLHIVNEGVNGDPFTEFRIRNTSNTLTKTSWSIGAFNLDNDKLVISNATDVNTGASPSYGNKVMTIKTTGEIGIGTTEPSSKLEIADGDIYISDIEKGIIMKSSNAQCWRGTLDNSGNLIFVAISCPEIGGTKIQQLKSTESIILFPNPTENRITIGIKESNLNNLNYSITDISGKIVLKGQMISKIETIEMSEFNPGIYLLNVFDEKGIVLSSSKIIKE